MFPFHLRFMELRSNANLPCSVNLALDILNTFFLNINLYFVMLNVSMTVGIFCLYVRNMIGQLTFAMVTSLCYEVFKQQVKIHTNSIHIYMLFIISLIFPKKYFYPLPNADYKVGLIKILGPRFSMHTIHAGEVNWYRTSRTLTQFLKSRKMINLWPITMATAHHLIYLTSMLRVF